MHFDKTNLFCKTKNMRNKGNKKHKNMCYSQASVQIEMLRQELETETSKNSEFQRQSAHMTAKMSDLEHSWSGFHLKPKDNVSNCKKSVEKAKFAGVNGVRKHPKIKVNHQMDDVILLDSASQVNIFKQKDCAEKNISKGKY